MWPSRIIVGEVRQEESGALARLLADELGEPVLDGRTVQPR